jgi:thioredoxin-dependent peroxiredoxin
VIAPGQKLDLNFRVKVWRDGVIQDVDFHRLLGRRTLVSVFMKNNTPTCDRQKEVLADYAADFARAGCAIVAISRDTCGSHARYATKAKLGYALVSDPDYRFAQAAEMLVEKTLYGRKFRGPLRALLLLDQEGAVLLREEVDTANQGAQLQRIINSL